MALFFLMITITVLIITGQSKQVSCDDILCDFGTCNKGNDCQYNQYICTDKASQCLLHCNSNCNGISITSSAQYTEILCNKPKSCTDVEISVLGSNNALYLECKKSSCININIQSNPHSTVECQDYDQSQCNDNVNTVWITDETALQTTTTVKPTSNPTTKPTLKPTVRSVSDVVSSPTPKPYGQTSIPIIDTLPPTRTQFLRETIIITKTIVIFANQTTSNVDGSWIALGVFSGIFGIVTCIAMICVKLFNRNSVVVLDDNNEDKQNNIIHNSESVGTMGPPGTTSCHNSPESDIYEPYKTSEGDIRLSVSLDGEYVDTYDARCSYDGLYEGRNSTHNTKQYTELNNEFDRIHIVDEQSLRVSLDILEDSLPDETMVTSLSSDDLGLLYGPGNGERKTPQFYED